MLRILFTTQPGTGHLHPLLSTARTLAGRGHDVAVAAAPSFGPAVRATGLRPVAAGLEWSTRDIAATFPDVTAIPPGPARYRWARETLFAGATARAMADDLVALAGRWRPDLVVREAAEYGGALAAEALDVPHAVVRSDTGNSSYAERGLVAGVLDGHRRRLGLPSDPEGAMAFRYLSLSFAPEGLDDPPADAAPTAHHFRPEGADAEAFGRSRPSWLDRLQPDRPTVYATLGTAFNTQTALFDAIVGAFVDEPVNVVLTVGHEQDPTTFAMRRPGTLVERWIPQHDVLAVCDAVVTHGGYGTVAAALTHGRPLVLLPISADQPINAARVAAIGAGLVVGAADRGPAAIRQAVRTVLDDASYRRAAVDVGRRSRDRPDLTAAVDRLERLAVERTPQLRDGRPAGAAPAPALSRNT